MSIRKAIIKEIDEYFAVWGSMHYFQIGTQVEIIINKHFKAKMDMSTVKEFMQRLSTDDLENILHEIIVERYDKEKESLASIGLFTKQRIHDAMIQHLYVEYEKGKVCAFVIAYFGMIQCGVWYDRVIMNEDDKPSIKVRFTVEDVEEE